jgi:hypothetical protein
MFAGLFLAVSAVPMALIVGSFAFRRVYGVNLPSAIDVGTNTAAVLLGLAFFVFMSGLVAKPKAEGNPQVENG